VWVAWLLGCSIGGRRVGLWSALILQSSLLYFVMARMLTPDIFLTQFVAWAMYFFWRSWLVLPSTFNLQLSTFLKWHLAGWIAIALGFLTKGPIALVIPLVAMAALVIYRRKSFSQWKLLLCGLAGGVALFLVLVLPWFLAVFQKVPEAFHYMVFGQAAGHLLGTTIKNRHGNFFYFFGVLAFGLLPWTWLLGWLWRRAHWNGLDVKSKDAWVLLNVWAIFTFALFTFSQAKLPAYILPIFPALAVLVAFRFFNEEKTPGAPNWVWRLCAASPMLILIAVPLALPPIFHVTLPTWMKWQVLVAAVVGLGIFWLAKRWNNSARAAIATGLGIFSLMVIVAEVPLFETDFKSNQTLKPLGLALRENVKPGDAVVCWGRLPQGLPFYSGDAISATNRPYFGGMDLTQVPFEFPGNRERLGELLLTDETELANLLAKDRRVWIVSFGDTIEHFQDVHGAIPLRLMRRIGQWELFSNR
jgi:4-amino-4-deoxy-L-arabinose transferase-like glycosyltransferase